MENWIDELDNLLAQLEDTAKGYEGDMVTKARGMIQDNYYGRKNPLETIISIPKDVDEVRVKKYTATIEQEIDVTRFKCELVINRKSNWIEDMIVYGEARLPQEAFDSAIESLNSINEIQAD